MKTSESIANIAADMIKFRKELKQPSKTGRNPHFNSSFVPLESVMAAVTEALSVTELSFLAYPCSREDRSDIGCGLILMHTTGEFIEFEPFFLPLTKETAQAGGSSLTYSRRYAISTVFGISSDEDDDGNSASENKSNNKPNKQQQKQQSKPKVITKVQIDDIKTKASQLAERNGGDLGAVYKALEITDINKLSKEDADGRIESLIAWLGGE
ncbi:MAG: ERF family protein [Brochothrix thermosphacta]|uniref:ERF family protein n=1 Tax=Brochothrix thermosphacta TaxID=2756 RepID=UPI003F905E0D